MISDHSCTRISFYSNRGNNVENCTAIQDGFLTNTAVQTENFKIIHCIKIFLLKWLFKYPIPCTLYIFLFWFSTIQITASIQVLYYIFTLFPQCLPPYFKTKVTYCGIYWNFNLKLICIFNIYLLLFLPRSTHCVFPAVHL